MRIAHVSDIHIRNLKYHDGYRRVFEDFYRKLENHRVDLVVNTGDTAHTKTNISPEFVAMASELLSETAKRAPVLSVLGNHDLNLMNADRQDAITPIVAALDDPRVKLLKKSGYHWEPSTLPIMFWNFGIADAAGWPRGPYPEERINVGLFHGSIRGCVTDSNFRMTNVEHDLSMFDGLDFAMMGDIHKRQSFSGGRIWYAGSMIQQNFGEEPEKGFLLWDIRSRTDWDVSFIELYGSRRFYTVGLDLNGGAIPPGSRIRIRPDRTLTVAEQKAVERAVRDRYQPHDIVTLGTTNIAVQPVGDVGGARIDDLRDLAVQDRLLREFLAPRQLPEPVLRRVLDLNRKLQVALDQRDDVARNVRWRVLKMGWSNVYNYGEGNVLDFSRIRGLTGIFAPNTSGKSGLVDVLSIGAFDANTKEVSKNVHLINDNRDTAVIVLELLVGRERFTVERVLERVKYGQRSGSEGQWGKTALKFFRVGEDGALESLVDESRPGTERNIRRQIGTFEDFMLTSMLAQWDPMDLIKCKGTERKRILYRFLDLDTFEEKYKMVREEASAALERLTELEDRAPDEFVRDVEARVRDLETLIGVNRADLEAYAQQVRDSEAAVERLLTQKVKSDVAIDPAAEQRRLKRVNQKLDELAQPVSNEAVLLEHAEVSGRLSGYDEALHEENVYRLKSVEAELLDAWEQHQRFGQQLKDRRRQVTVLGEVPCGDQFPTCKFLTDAMAAERGLPELEAMEQNAAARKKELTAQAEPLRRSRQAIEAAAKDRARLTELEARLQLHALAEKNRELERAQLEAEREQIQSHLRLHAQAQRDVERNREIDEEIRELRVRRKEIDSRIRQAQEALALHSQRLGADREELERTRAEAAELEEVREMCRAYECFQSAVGKDGVALQILTKKLPLINQEIDRILRPAAGFSVQIEHDPDEQSVRLYLQYGDYRGRVLELGSGAEKFLASLAIRSALLNVSNLPRSNMFIIDEGFGQLDTERLEDVQRMFDYLKSVFDHVIVISHTDVMKDFVDNTIDIVSDDDGYAHVEVGA